MRLDLTVLAAVTTLAAACGTAESDPAVVDTLPTLAVEVPASSPDPDPEPMEVAPVDEPAEIAPSLVNVEPDPPEPTVVRPASVTPEVVEHETHAFDGDDCPACGRG